MIISDHCKLQASARYLENELAEGIRKIEAAEVSSTITGEINFIVERKTQILHRKGSNGDLVIIGVDWNYGIVKSIFLQRQKQVHNRQARGRQYKSLLR